MKRFSRRFTFQFFFLLATFIYISTSCNNNHIACQSPPPSLFFKVLNAGSVYPSVSDTSAALRISYQSGGQQKYLTDIRKIDDFYDSSMIIAQSWDLDNPEFTLELNGQVLTKIKLETYMNNAKCQGWPSVSKVYENGELAEKTENRYYLFGSN